MIVRHSQKRLKRTNSTRTLDANRALCPLLHFEPSAAILGSVSGDSHDQTHAVGSLCRSVGQPTVRLGENSKSHILEPHHHMGNSVYRNLAPFEPSHQLFLIYVTRY